MKYQVSDALMALAAEWEVYASTMEDAKGTVRLCVRCRDCDGTISSEGGIEFTSNTQASAFHLMTSHGYRMDGKQYDNAGNYIRTAGAPS